MGSNVPSVRREIEEIIYNATPGTAVTIPIETLSKWLQRLKRQQPARGRRTGSRPFNHEIVKQIFHLVDTTEMNQQQIATRVDQNTGRISECENVRFYWHRGKSIDEIGRLLPQMASMRISLIVEVLDNS